jgi:hypothetical protein
MFLRRQLETELPFDSFEQGITKERSVAPGTAWPEQHFPRPADHRRLPEAGPAARSSASNHRSPSARQIDNLVIRVRRGNWNLSTAVGWPLKTHEPAAAESILTAQPCGGGLATGPTSSIGDTRNPPTSMGGTTVTVKDSGGVERGRADLATESHEVLTALIFILPLYASSRI